MKKRLSIFLLSLILVFGFLCPASAQPDYATRKIVLEMILNGADAYYEGIQASDIMKGDGDGNLRENDPVLRVEAMAMLSRAFPNLPIPSEYQLSIGNFGNEFTDLPQWAVQDLSNLTRAGIVAGYPDGRLGVNDPVTVEQMELLLRRIWAYLGKHQKDDFYSTQNRQWLNTASLSADELMTGTFQEVEETVSAQLKEIVTEMANGDWEEHSSEQRVKEFYQSAVDMESRNKEGLNPLSDYLERYEAADTVKELLIANHEISRVIGSDILGRFADEDIYNGQTFAPYISGMSCVLEKVYFETEDETAKQAYLTLVSDMLQLGGESKSDADKHAKMLYEMEREVSLASSDYNDYNVKNIYKKYRSPEVYSVLSSYPAECMSPWDKTGYFFVVDDARVKKTVSYFTEEHLETLKAYMKFWLLYNSSVLLSEEMQQPYLKFSKTMYGVTYQPDTKTDAFQLVLSYLGSSVEETYVKQYGSEITKESVTQLARKIRNVFKSRLEQSDWLSEKTKKQAIRKLDSIVINVAYPEEFFDPFAEKKPFDKSLFENVCIINSYYTFLNYSILGEKSEQKAWPIYSYAVNAAYVPGNNSITIPMGILQAPFYHSNASTEENLGGIGTIIAHEIIHAFDATGSQYDYAGTLFNWWTDSDKKAFEKKCSDAEAFFDNWEISNHAKNDGALTLGENIADLGGVACILDLMKESKKSDYQTFFTQYARIWRQYGKQSYMNYLSQNDVHSCGKIRVNRVLMNFEEFYQAFDIQPGDGMYLPPNERISIW